MSVGFKTVSLHAAAAVSHFAASAGDQYYRVGAGVKRLCIQLLGPIAAKSRRFPLAAPLQERSRNYLKIQTYITDNALDILQVECLKKRGNLRPPSARPRILHLARRAPSLALRARRRDEDPPAEEHRPDQRQHALQQLPTRVHSPSSETRDILPQAVDATRPPSARQGLEHGLTRQTPFRG